jgi:thymidylate synthase
MTGEFEGVSPRLYRNAEEALVGEAALLVKHGQPVTVRGSTTRELLARTFTITDPVQRVVALPHRQNHLAATIVDTLWVLSGRNDIIAITPYLPRAPQYSDDGRTWHGGYGPRLRSWRGTDQLDYVRRLLLSDPHSRRAVISLYDPAADSVLGSEADGSPVTLGWHAQDKSLVPRGEGRSRKAPPLAARGTVWADAPPAARLDSRLDVPCNNWLHFLLRDGRLDMFVVARSNDLIWGFSGINAFQWSVLHELMAQWIGAAVGRQHWAVSSMHLYERHLERARRIVATWDGAGTYTATTTTTTTNRYAGRWERFDADLATWFEIERELRTANEPRWDPGFTDRVQDPFLQGCLMVVEDYWRTRAGLPPDLAAVSGAAAATMGADLVAAMRSFRDQQALVRSSEPPRRASGGGLALSAARDDSRPHAMHRGRPPVDRPASEDVARLKKDLRALHRMKSAAYGDSWKRRGELFGVLPNVARKIDRLGRQVHWQADDRESAADTWADLVVYLLKYQTLLADRDATVAAILFGASPNAFRTPLNGGADGDYSDGVAAFEALLSDLEPAGDVPSPQALEADLDRLQKLVETSSLPQARCDVLRRMAAEAFAGLLAAAAPVAGAGRSDR